MGTMIFQLPADLPSAARADLERATVLGGQDNMPFQTQVLLDGQQALLHRSIQDSGPVLVPWSVPGAGRLMVSTGCLMERLKPYQLPLELARGKVNQLRNQASDWLLGGLVLPPDAQSVIRAASLSFSQAASRYPDAAWEEPASRALAEAFRGAEALVHAYMAQVMQIRHQRQPKLDTLLAARVYPGTWVASQEAAYRESFNSITLPMPWAMVEPAENDVNWNACDDLVNWATQQQLNIVAGPLIDFSGRGLPDWLWEKDTDLLSLCGYLSDYVGMVVQRYHGLVRSWQITAGSNTAGVLALADEELLWLTVRLVEAARRVDPNLDIIIGVSQPFGDYLVHQERNQSPFAFADTLLRTGLRLGGLELEMVMGVDPRGSYCRDLLDASRLLDLYALLGLPIHLTLGYPSAASADPQADSDLRPAAGHWRTGYLPDSQSDWASHLAALAVCKPYVKGVHWAHWSDAGHHQFPHCGLIDADGNAKPALEVLKNLRAEHLK